MSASTRRQRRSSLDSRSTRFRKTALASAVAVAMAPGAALQAADWGRNVELFVNPSSKRTLAGGRLLQPLLQDNLSLTYFDFRGTVNIGNTDEINVGLGHRRMVADRRWILGAYAAFDTRESITDNRHNQVTFGLEALSTQWDFRANYYLPISDEDIVATIPGVPSGDLSFTGFDLIQPFTQGSNVFEEALEGVDVEAGSLLPFIPFGETRIFIGAYHFDGDTIANSTGMGLRARLEFRPRKDITLGIATKHDNLFGTETTFQINYSFGYPAETGVRSMNERMIQFVERDIDVVETSDLPFNDRSLTDPDSPTSVVVSNNVVHIDNTADGGGDGSFEDRFNSLAECKAEFDSLCGFDAEDSIVYVWAGDETATGLDESLTLQDNQKLIGQGHAWQPIEGGGTIGGEAFPLWDPSGDNAVVLANNNEVAGLHITGAEGAIVGENITGFNIHHNQLVNNEAGVRIETFAESSVTSEGVIADNQITGNKYGIGLFTGAEGAGNSATQTVTVTNNTVSDNIIGMEAFNYGIDGGTATQTVTLTGNTVNDNEEFGLLAVNEDIAVSELNGQVPIPETATQEINITGGNSFNNNGGEGAVFANIGKYGTASQTVNISGSNSFSNNGAEGALFMNSGKYHGTATQDVSISGTNTFSGNDSSGALFANFGKYNSTATQNVAIDGSNHFDNNGLDSPMGAGASFYNAEKYDGPSSTVTQNVDITGSNTFNENTKYGAVFANDAEGYNSLTATQNVLIDGNNTFNGNGADGAYFYNYADEGGTATQSVEINGSNTFNNNDDEGAFFQNYAYEYGTATQNVTIEGSNTFNTNGGEGAYFRNEGKYDGSATQNIVISDNNTFNDNDSDGIFFGNEGYDSGIAIQDIDLSGGNQLTGNAYYGVYLNNDEGLGGGATQTIDLTGADLSGNGGAECYASNNGTQTIIGDGGACD